MQISLLQKMQHCFRTNPVRFYLLKLLNRNEFPVAASAINQQLEAQTLMIYMGNVILKALHTRLCNKQ